MNVYLKSVLVLVSIIALHHGHGLANNPQQATQTIAKRPADFVRLRELAPSIIQEMRYAGQHNFVGRPLPGYVNGECWLTQATAEKLALIQQQLQAMDYSLKVYDCYRPQRAVNAFIAWSKDIQDQVTKAEFYPHVEKQNVFELGYVAKRSGHSRGSTVDLTIVNLPATAQPAFSLGQTLQACYLPQKLRYQDNSIDMGTGYDCFDRRSHPDNDEINPTAKHNRQLLQDLMFKQGFLQSKTEWWHFTLKQEPYPDTYFDFDVQ